MDRFMRDVARKVDGVNRYTGERFISDARQTRTYTDKTSNLRNSIGYSVVGEDPVTEVGQGEGGAEGASLLAEKSREITTGLVLAAGMNYAAAVEAKGYDVITESVNRAKVNHKRMLEKALKI